MKLFLVALVNISVWFAAAQSTNLRGGEVVAKHAPPPRNHKMIEATIQIGGLTHKPTAEELAMLNQVMTKSYNLSFEEAREAISNPIENQEKDVEVDMDELAGIATVSFWYRFDWYSGYCRLCIYTMDDWHSYYATYRKGSDDDHAALMAASYAEDHIVQIHDKFEKRMCNELKETGLANFAQASECMFTFNEESEFDTVDKEKHESKSRSKSEFGDKVFKVADNAKEAVVAK